jgi:flagellar motor switch protein FliN/FliY
VIELDRPAGDPLDVHVNDRLVAHGEVVMVSEHYGVRFTEPVDSAETHK